MNGLSALPFHDPFAFKGLGLAASLTTLAAIPPMFKAIFFCLGLLPIALFGQSLCDPSSAPQNLSAEFMEGFGLLLQWDAVPGSRGAQIRVQLPSTEVHSTRISGLEPDHWLIPEWRVVPGLYTWRVQLSCDDVAPYQLSPVSEPDTFYKGPKVLCPLSVSDIEGHVYPIVALADQCWMGENLKTRLYSNGDSIPFNPASEDWRMLNSGAASSYMFNNEHNSTYGLLYNWYAAVDSRGLCPEGWHLPLNREWKSLIVYLGASDIAGGSLKSTGTLGAGTGLWQAPNTSASNSSQFSAVPAGFRSDNGTFYNIGYSSSWWTASDYNAVGAWNREVDYYGARIYRLGSYKRTGYSIRCVQD